MNIPLTHFHQMNGVKAPLTGGCDDIWDQDAREALCWTVQQAEELIAHALGFWPAPKFITDEQIQFNLPGVRSDWQNAEVRTEFGFIECFGREKLTLVEAGATVTYSDYDGDPLGREELATIEGGVYAYLPACADPCSVAVFFRTADGAIDTADSRFEIRPLDIDIDGDAMSITGEASLFIKPLLWNLTQADCAGSGNPNAWKYDFDLGNLVSAVDVYCRTVNIESPLTLYWDGVCACGGVCQHSTQTGCAYNTDKRRGTFAPRPSTWNGTTNVGALPTYCSAPESVFANYWAGYPLDRYCRMDPKLERAIVQLTNVLLPEPPCGYCDLALRKWKLDRTPIDPLTTEAANLPWPGLYFRGALEAWRIVKGLALGRGGKMGRGNR
jgi:hypothetical protein